MEHVKNIVLSIPNGDVGRIWLKASKRIQLTRKVADKTNLNIKVIWCRKP